MKTRFSSENVTPAFVEATALTLEPARSELFNRVAMVTDIKAFVVGVGEQSGMVLNTDGRYIMWINPNQEHHDMVASIRRIYSQVMDDVATDDQTDVVTV